MRKLLMLALAVIVGLCYSLPASAQQQQGDKKFEVNGEVRFRADFSENAADFDDDLDDAGLVWPWRVRAGIHGSFARNVSAHVEFQAFGHAGDGGNGFFDVSGTSDGEGNADLYQGWVELGDIGGGSFDLRLGRQELMFGSEMLLGDNDFYNGVVHDGAKAAWQYKKWSLDVWYTKFDETATFVPFFPFAVDNPNTDTVFLGAYAVFKAPKKIGFDAYWLLANDDSTGEERSTYGGRVYSKWDSNWSWNAELALQTGDSATADVDISAMGFEGELGYQWKKVKVRPRVYGRYHLYTGDDDPADDEDNDFDPLFQDNHARFGYSDLFFASDLEVVAAGISWNGKEDRHVFGAEVLSFTENEAAAGADDDLGQEIDLYYMYAYSRNVQIAGAIANFSPGDAFTPDDGVMRVYANTRLRW